MPRVLFVTRKFPPSVGGMETLAADVWRALEGTGARLVAHGGSNRALPLFLPRAVWTTVRASRRREADLVLAGDVLMYLALRPFTRVGRLRLATMAMGKDVVWRSRPYQWLVRRWLPDALRVLAISGATGAAAVGAGVDPDRVQVVRLGVEVPTGEPEPSRTQLRARLGVQPGTVVIATLGRLVPRKGVAWFVSEVLPRLPQTCVYIVAGDGEDRARVLAARAALEDPDRVRVLGPVSDDDRELVLRGCDIFALPNIPVAGDMEGFGLVAVEAGMRGALVVASELEGLRDAVIDGVTGVLVPAEDADAWVEHLTRLLNGGTFVALAATYAASCREEFDRDRMGAELRRIVGALAQGPSRA